MLKKDEKSYVNRVEHDKIETTVDQYPDMFTGFGVLPFTYRIQLKVDAQPVVHAPRQVPAPLRDKLSSKKWRSPRSELILWYA